MEFANWLFENNWYPDTGYLKDNLWVNEYGVKKYTTQLYDEFQKIYKPKSIIEKILDFLIIQIWKKY